MLEELGMRIKTKAIYSDNQGAIKIATVTERTGRIKHLDTELQFTRFNIKNYNIEIRYVHSSDNIADILTKSLGRLNFSQLADLLVVSFDDTLLSREGVKV